VVYCFRSWNCDGDPVRANSKNLEAVLNALRRAGVVTAQNEHNHFTTQSFDFSGTFATYFRIRELA
jgi:hypothetical protein